MGMLRRFNVCLQRPKMDLKIDIFIYLPEIVPAEQEAVKAPQEYPVKGGGEAQKTSPPSSVVVNVEKQHSHNASIPLEQSSKSVYQKLLVSPASAHKYTQNSSLPFYKNYRSL